MKLNYILMNLLLLFLSVSILMDSYLKTPQHHNYEIILVYDVETFEQNEEYPDFAKLIQTNKAIKVEVKEDGDTINQTFLSFEDQPVNNSTLNSKINRISKNIKSLNGHDPRGLYLIKSIPSNLAQVLAKYGLAYSERTSIDNITDIISNVTENKLWITVFLLLVWSLLNSVFRVLANSRNVFLKKIDGFSDFQIWKNDYIHLLIENISVFFILFTVSSFYILLNTEFSYYRIFATTYLSLFALLLVALSFLFWISNSIYKIAPDKWFVREIIDLNILKIFMTFFRIFLLINLVFSVQSVTSTYKKLSLINSSYSWNELSNYQYLELSGKLPREFDKLEQIGYNLKKLNKDNAAVLLSFFNRGYEYHESDFNPGHGNVLTVNKNFISRVTIRKTDNTFLDLHELPDSKITILIPNFQKNNTKKIIEASSQWVSFLTESKNEIDFTTIPIADNQSITSFSYVDNIYEIMHKNAIIIIIDENIISPDIYTSFISDRFILVQPNNNYRHTIEKLNLTDYISSNKEISKEIEREIRTESLRLIVLIASLLVNCALLIIIDMNILKSYLKYRQKEIYLCFLEGFSFKDKYKKILYDFSIVDFTFFICVNLLFKLSFMNSLIILLIFCIKYWFIIFYLYFLDKKKIWRV